MAGSDGALSWYWGDLHNHCAISYGHGSLARALALARQQLDFVSVTGHAFWPDIPDDPDDPAHYSEVRRFTDEGFARLRTGWNEVQRQMAAAREPGVFETFLSYEWHSRADGDHHVVYRSDHGPLVGGERIGDVKDALGRAEKSGQAPPAIVVPHHIGYKAGYRGINWETFTPDGSPFVEIYSLHGCSESADAPYPMLHRMGPRDAHSTASRGLRHGRRVGLVASTDHHSGYPGSHGHGLLAAAATSLSREALWEAFLARRVYAATGDRIKLNFRINDVWMGQETAAAQRHISVGVRARDAIDHVELLKNERRLVRWNGPDPARASEAAERTDAILALVRIEWGWGPAETVWDFRMKLEGGRFERLETCFAGPAIVVPREGHEESDAPPHEMLERGETSCAWRSVTQPNPTVRHSATQGVVALVEMRPQEALTLEVNGQRITHSLADLLEGPRSHFQRGWLSDAVVLRALPAAVCTLEETYADNAGGDETAPDCYRVRVAQRNGHWAWSSPIWVTAG